MPVGGVSFLPQGRGKQAAAAAASASAHGGSTESLNSTQSLTLSNLSFGSTTSTGETPDLLSDSKYSKYNLSV